MFRFRGGPLPHLERHQRVELEDIKPDPPPHLALKGRYPRQPTRVAVVPHPEGQADYSPHLEPEVGGGSGGEEAALEVEDEGLEGVGVGGCVAAQDKALDCSFLESGYGGDGVGGLGFV